MKKFRTLKKLGATTEGYEVVFHISIDVEDYDCYCLYQQKLEFSKEVFENEIADYIIDLLENCLHYPYEEGKIGDYVVFNDEDDELFELYVPKDMEERTVLEGIEVYYHDGKGNTDVIIMVDEYGDDMRHFCVLP